MQWFFWILNLWRLAKMFLIIYFKILAKSSFDILINYILYKKKIVYLEVIVYIIFDFKFVLNLAFITLNSGVL